MNLVCITCVCHRISECTDSEAETVMQLRSELRDKEMKLTDIRLEALSSAHQLDQLRESMNRMQVSICFKDSFKNMFKKIVLPSCRFHTRKTLVNLWTQMKIILMKSESFWPCIDSNATTTFKAQKLSKDFVK